MMYTGKDVDLSLPVSEKGLKMRFLAGIEHKVARLPGGMTAEIDDMTGEVTIIQSDVHAVVLTPEQMGELISWTVFYHLGYLNAKADQASQGGQCFECRELLTTAYIYRLQDGDIELCSRCHASVKQTVQEIQQCSKCGKSTQGQQSYTVTCGGDLVEVCFTCFAQIAEAEFSAAQTEL